METGCVVLPGDVIKVDPTSTHLKLGPGLGTLVQGQLQLPHYRSTCIMRPRLGHLGGGGCASALAVTEYMARIPCCISISCHGVHGKDSLLHHQCVRAYALSVSTWSAFGARARAREDREGGREKRVAGSGGWQGEDGVGGRERRVAGRGRSG